MAICKICGMQVVAGEVYHADCIDAATDEIRRQSKILHRTLNAAINDIPHVGNYCAHLDERGYCGPAGELCCRRVHTRCPYWKWRGLEL